MVYTCVKNEEHGTKVISMRLWHGQEQTLGFLTWRSGGFKRGSLPYCCLFHNSICVFPIEINMICKKVSAAEYVISTQE